MGELRRGWVSEDNNHHALLQKEVAHVRHQ
jgi:hypothetical protein